MHHPPCRRHNPDNRSGRPIIPIPRGQALLFLVTLCILAGCTTPRILIDHAKQRPEPATKRTPVGAKVPATQRPYIIKGKTYYPLPSASGFQQTGIASWYGPNFHGHKTANGETYDMHARTAAHKTLPINTQLLVTNLENGRETVVRINDRGPFVNNRIIDLSLTAAKEIGVVKPGTARVRIAALGEAVTIRQRDKTVNRFLPHVDFNSGAFYVQIGSFTNRQNAERLKTTMLKAGKKVLVQPYDRGDALFFRVRVRAGKNLIAAKKTAQHLRQNGYPGFVVSR